MLFSRREFWEEMVLVGEIVFCSLTRYRILGQMLGQVGAKLLLGQGDIAVGDPLGRASVWCGVVWCGGVGGWMRRACRSDEEKPAPD
ncbi:MAG: hypothetical protein FD175_2791 [Beijerinckiaceae bacterium]|nr:MAG: hypothetical protein FD175_2791 [Beijerinckiaceae bacterium]